MSSPPEIAIFFGRLHVLLVHMPIALIGLLAALELLAKSPRFKLANANAGVILMFAVPMAILTALLGWLLSLAGGYQDRLLQWHKWTGIGTAAILLLAGCFYWLELKKAYRGTLLATLLVMIVASHFGGSLTHGSDYLVRYAPGPLRAWLNPAPKVEPVQVLPKPKELAEVQVFAGVVQPVLQQNCVSCHGPEKSKAHLRLDTFAQLMKGGENGAVIVPGKPDESELLKRVRLPLTEDNHMPPDGKPQPSHEDILLLQWWIDVGAPGDKKVGELKAPMTVTRILNNRFGSPSPATAKKTKPPKELSEIVPLAASIADDLKVPITLLSPKEPWLQCNASVAGTNFDDGQLAKLAPLAANLKWLDLAGTAVTDTGLGAISSMDNLIRLHLERTAITDGGLKQVAGLSHLQYLNLYGTGTTAAGLETLQKMPSLKQLYLWQTKISPQEAKAFAAARTDEDQIQRWQDEIEQLQAKIREGHITVDVGTIMAVVPATNAAPVNAQCPVSGKPVDPTKTVIHEGSVVAFCCDDCKAKFLQDPKPLLAKLNLSKEPKSENTK